MKTILKTLRQTIHEFIEDGGIYLAASLSFFATLSVVPLLLLVISGVGYFLGEQEVMLAPIFQWVHDTIPQVEAQLKSFFRHLVDKKGTSGWLGLVSLLLVATLLFVSIERVLDKVFHISRPRGFWHSRLYSLIFLFPATLLLLIPSQLNWLLQNLPGIFQIDPFWKFLSGVGFYFFAHGIAFFIFVAFIPRRSMKKTTVLGGSFIVFRFNRISPTSFSVVYGGCASALPLDLWVFVYFYGFIAVDLLSKRDFHLLLQISFCDSRAEVILL